ncbi:PPOX class F420-dependent oxidoreductase [Micromonospora sp. NPDC049523]|uniref:PPOX class F420-dependent oxidoreductase n=1 Tax=Micromonospora sp. NPDC049523 TaxID=3155921 RepID=UPI0034217112
MSNLDRLATAKYVLLTTFRRDGRAVGTPVWVVRDGDALAAWTAADAGKAKRIRRSGQVTVAPCDVRGTPQGEAVSARAVITDRAGAARIRELLRHKYGLVARLTLLASRVRRGADGAVGIRIVLPE